jgi:hypothetical protein
MEYWIIGVLDEYRTDEHGSSFSANRDMIVCLVKVIGQKPNRGSVLK